MNKNRGIIILSIILAVQFIIPLSVWGYETYKNKELDEKGQEVKILVDRIQYNSNVIEFDINDLSVLTYMDNNSFIVFEVADDGFSVPVCTADLSESDLYVTVNKLASLYRESWSFTYKSQTTNSQNEYGFYVLYDKAAELENIDSGRYDGPETQAYAVFKVYKNRIKVVNVYIDGVPADTVLEKYSNKQYDISRYEFYENEVFEEYFDEEAEEYTELTDVNGDIVTESSVV